MNPTITVKVDPVPYIVHVCMFMFANPLIMNVQTTRNSQLIDTRN